MSDTMMSVALARRLTDGGRHTVHTGLVMPAARAIVHLAEQNERLQDALEHAMYYSAESISDLIQSGIITDEDMEAPE